jgi:NADH:ubiquinone oxidoreductase subunit K
VIELRDMFDLGAVLQLLALFIAAVYPVGIVVALLMLLFRSFKD